MKRNLPSVWLWEFEDYFETAAPLHAKVQRCQSMVFQRNFGYSSWNGVGVGEYKDVKVVRGKFVILKDFTDF